MTKDELIALRRERGKQELNIGDRVKVYDRDGNLMYGGKTAIIIEKALLDPTEFYYGLYVEGETTDKYRGKGLLYLKNTATKIGETALLAPFFAEDLELMSDPKPSKEKPTDEIKVGDIVRVKRETPSGLYNNLPYDMPFFIAEIERDCDNPMNDTFLLRNGKTCLNIHPHWLEKWDAKTQPSNTITIPVKADFGEDVGFALLDRALELQKKYTELEGEVKRLYDVILARQIERFTVYTPFNNHNLSLIAGTLNNFRPLTAEERLQQEAELKEFIDKTLKKQSE